MLALNRNSIVYDDFDFLCRITIFVKIDLNIVKPTYNVKWDSVQQIFSQLTANQYMVPLIDTSMSIRDVH